MTGIELDPRLRSQIGKPKTPRREAKSNTGVNAQPIEIPILGLEKSAPTDLVDQLRDLEDEWEKATWVRKLALRSKIKALEKRIRDEEGPIEMEVIIGTRNSQIPIMPPETKRVPPSESAKERVVGEIEVQAPAWIIKQKRIEAIK